MKATYLFPSKYKKLGWSVFIPASIFGLLHAIFHFEFGFFDWNVFSIFIDEFMGEKKLMGFVDNNVLDEILGILIIISGFVVAFSKSKDEDELISKIRLESLVWATFLNYTILLFAMLLVYDMGFLWVMIFNMFTTLLFFIIRFTWMVNKLKKLVRNEE